MEAKHSIIKKPLEVMFYPEWLNIWIDINMFVNTLTQLFTLAFKNKKALYTLLLIDIDNNTAISHKLFNL